MNTRFFGYWAPLWRAFKTGHVFRATTKAEAPQNVHAPSHAIAMAAQANCFHTPQSISRGKPLRIIQWADNTGHGTRRIVMSGRFADICAELDRLAALESP